MPKKKGKKKKGKKKKGKKNESLEPPSEFDYLEPEVLTQRIKEMEIDLNKLQIERNYMQLERDTISTFYDISRKEVKELDLEITEKDREMEMMEENHQVEIKVYIQKVKHLEYEHKNNGNAVDKYGTKSRLIETEHHRKRVQALIQQKRASKKAIIDLESSQAQQVLQLRQLHEKNLLKLREKFETNLGQLERSYEEKLTDLTDALELQRKVEIHEMEERKNLHINDLMKNHQKAFGQIKDYYNEITTGNLKLIKELKAEVAKLKTKAEQNAKMVADISQENKELMEPLGEAVRDVQHLRHALKDREKDMLSLSNAKSRFALLNKKEKILLKEHAELREKYGVMEREREELDHNFEASVKREQKNTQLKNLLLEKNLHGLERLLDQKVVQFKEAVVAAELDPTTVDTVTERLDFVLKSRNELITDLNYQLVRVTKAHDDMMRCFDEKFTEFGLPFDPEIGRLAGRTIAQSKLTHAPAGLVVTAV